MTGLRVVACFLALVCLSSGEEDYQQWSEQTYLDEPYSFTCNETRLVDEVLFVNPGDRLVWYRHHNDVVLQISNDDHFELKRKNDVDNMELVIKTVTDDLSGIYFCEVHTSNGTYIGRIIRGLNLGYHKYHDMIDKYRENIITGVIAAASVFVLIVGACALDTFRYLTDEQKAKKREQKEERLRRRRELKNGETNQGLNMTEDRNGKRSYNPNGLSQSEINTHL